MGFLRVPRARGIGLKLRIVSRASAWPRCDLDDDGVNVPATVPALRALEERGIAYVTTASLLSPGDYQAVWRSTFQTVWELVQGALRNDAEDGPNLMVIHSYSLYLLICEVQILARAFDHLADRHRITSVIVENSAAHDEEPSLFYGALFSPYYSEVAARWARDRAIPVTTMPTIIVDGVPERWRTRLRNVPGPFELRRLLRRKVIECAYDNPLSRSFVSIRRWFDRAKRSRRAVFFIPDRACGLGRGAPPNAIDALKHLADFATTGRLVTETAPAAPSIAEALHCQLGNSSQVDLIEGRWQAHIQSSATLGMAVFLAFAELLRHLRDQGTEAALVMAAPFVDWRYNGYMAEAFRKSRSPVGGIQHGGNSRLVRYGAVPTVLMEFIGGLFFQWGPASTDEFAQYGEEWQFRGIQTGSPRMAELMARSFVSRRKARRRLLYAPTTMSLTTTIGNNAVWDRYGSLVRSICQVLDESEWECWVKVLPAREMDALDLEDFTNLRVIRKGSFSDYMTDVDALVVDSLGGSPFYEAIATNKPIVLYPAAENQEWDPDFISMVRRRALCFWDGPSYLDGLKRFLDHPEDTLSNAGVRIDDALRSAYFPPATVAHLWSCIDRAFWPEVSNSDAPMGPFAADGRDRVAVES